MYIHTQCCGYTTDNRATSLVNPSYSLSTVNDGNTYYRDTEQLEMMLGAG
jgi:hypothetical protein